MNPITLIINDLNGKHNAKQRKEGSDSIQLNEEFPLLGPYHIYVVRGETDQFDFPMLPYGSYGYYAANGYKAICLTRTGKEIEQILQEAWPTLAHISVLSFSSFILQFYGSSSKETHHVLASKEDLLTYPKDYVLNSQEYQKIHTSVYKTCFLQISETEIIIQALTLKGWMHEKHDLGIEVFHILNQGSVHFEERKVLSTTIFTGVPEIHY